MTELSHPKLFESSGCISDFKKRRKKLGVWVQLRVQVTVWVQLRVRVQVWVRDLAQGQGTHSGSGTSLGQSPVIKDLHYCIADLCINGIEKKDSSSFAF